MRRKGLLALASSLTVIAAAAACAIGGVRPSFSPLRRALVDTVAADPPAVIQEIRSLVRQEGLQIQWSSPSEGYLETQWYNVVTRRAGRETGRARMAEVRASAPDHIIRLRFWADPIAPGRTLVTAEAVYIPSPDPSVVERELEEMVPPAHGGYEIVKRVIEGTKSKLDS